jgi:hypothetical protein
MAGYFIDNIFGAEEDQIECLFSVAFPKGFPGTPAGRLQRVPFNPLEAIVRIDKEFDIPAIKSPVKTIYYRGISIQKRIPKDETEKMIKISFRCDASWRIYDALYTWMISYFDPQTGGQENGKVTLKSLIKGEASLKTEMKFIALSGRKLPTKILTFKGCFINNLKPSAFNSESGMPTRIEYDLHYQTMENKGFLATSVV